MNTHRNRANTFLLAVSFSLVIFALGTFRSHASQAVSNPWSTNDAVEPSKFADELAHAGGSARPTILYVGFNPLFAGGHIEGATFHGTASNAQGIADLKKWAASLPRDTNLVIYCGCCPFGYCPNIRPAFVAFHEMGFTHLRVLVMPDSFATDWAQKGYPVEKGK
jgi:hypothetical protein